MNKWLITLLAIIISINIIDAQNIKNKSKLKLDTLTLDSLYFVDTNVLRNIRSQLNSSPIIAPNCPNLNCAKITEFRNAVYNILEDLKLYSDAVTIVSSIHKEQWFFYLAQNYKNEREKEIYIAVLAISDWMASHASYLLDIASMVSFWKGGAPPTSAGLSTFLRTLNALDGMLTQLNILTKVIEGDGTTSVLSKMFGNSVADGTYASLKGSIDITQAAVEEYQIYLKSRNAVAPSLSQTTTIIERSRIIRDGASVVGPNKMLEISNPARTNFLAAIGQLGLVISTYQRNKLKAHIAELNKYLYANQNSQSQHFQLHQLQREQVDLIKRIRSDFKNDYDLLNYISMNCGELRAIPRERKEISTGGGVAIREMRKEYTVNARTYGDALLYRKDILEKANKNLSNSWKGIIDCSSIENPYLVRVLDGEGKNYIADIKIISNEEIIYSGTLNTTNPINLFPKTYDIHISGKLEKDKVFKSNVEINDYVITGKEDRIFLLNPMGGDSIRPITFKPYGRVQLEVVDKKGNNINYSYSFNHKNSTISANEKMSKLVFLDLPANKKLSLKITPSDNTIKPIEIEDISLEAGKIKKLRYVFDEPSKDYQFNILDGVGNNITPYFQITKSSDGRNVYEMGPSKSTLIKLKPDEYTIDINSSIDFNFFEVSKATISKFKIDGSEEGLITLTPYGRINLDVVDKDGKPLRFGYEFSKNNKVIAYAKTRSKDLVVTDIQAEVPLDLELSYEFKSDIKKGITLIPGEINKLHYVYDDEKFIEEKTKIISKEPLNNITNKDKPIILKQSPEGWVSGILYNSNDGKCSEYQGKYFIFVNRNSQFLNLETGKYSEEIIVAPGEHINVAAPENGGHYSAHPLSISNDKYTKESNVSYWFPDDLKNGWWYSAGCKDGTKPRSSSCNNGVKDLEGVKSYDSCRTFGED